jgi:hypothetical protein
VREVFMSWLSAARPDLVPRYDELYERGAYAPQAERTRISKLVRTPNRSSDPRFSRTEIYARRREERRKSREQPVQKPLF